MANTLSGGQKRRLSVALAMIGDPTVVILDEPTTGLDPGARREVWGCLKEARRDRLIVLSVRGPRFSKHVRFSRVSLSTK